MCVLQVPSCPKCPDPAELRAAGHADADGVLGARGAGGEPGAQRESLLPRPGEELGLLC